MTSIAICIPEEAIGFNNAYKQSRQGRRFLSPKAKKFKEVARDLFSDFDFPVDRSRHYVTAEIHLYFQEMLTKDGLIKIRRYDLDGHMKFLIDSACEALGFDDSLILDLVAHKRPGKSQSIIMLRRHDLHTLDKS